MYTYSKSDREFIIDIVYTTKDEFFKSFNYRQYVNNLIENLRAVLNKPNNAK